MKSNLKKIKDCRVRLAVEVEPELIETRYQSVLKDIQKVVQLPGFRQGKAPLEMVEKKFSKEAEEETLKALIPEAYHQCVQNQSIHPVTLPSISEIEFQRGKKLTFSAEFERSPEFSLKNYKGIKLKRESAEVSDTELKRGIQSVLDSRAELVPLAETRPVQMGDVVVADIDVWSEGQYVPGKQAVLLQVELSEHDDFCEKIVGSQEGEAREIGQKISAGSQSDSATHRPNYRVWVRGIKVKNVPALNDELAQSFGQESVQALEEVLKKDMARQKHSQSMEAMKKELFEKLLDQNPFVVPVELLNKQKERLLDQTRRQYEKMSLPESKLNENLERIQKEADRRAEEQVRLYFILQKIAESEEIEVDEIELETRIQALVRETGRPVEEVRRVFEQDLRMSLVESHAVDFLIANAKFEET